MAAFFMGVCQELSVRGDLLTSTGDTGRLAGIRESDGRARISVSSRKAINNGKDALDITATAADTG
jgi:hypothetical protein